MGEEEDGGHGACVHSLSFQKMELALVPLSAHGNFYEGDCYVILSVSAAPAPALIPTNFSPSQVPLRDLPLTLTRPLVPILTILQCCTRQASSLTIF